ncbi:stonin-1 [Myxocyprinus asiaticus]|uniref:stonin-1 n=1 Tax=Myxocyprinus asiaticus TaxID=70543 RepID=UPI002221CA51|nr:stonin-1 [Myxocyprinus asiaticus]
MCSMNHPTSWVTFEDEGTPFSSPQKSLCSSTSTSGSIPRPNGLKLVLPPLGNESWRFSTFLESPSVDFSHNGSSCVPSNTPMSTPVRATPAGQSPFHCGPHEQPNYFSSSLNSFSPELQRDSMKMTEGSRSLDISQHEPGHLNPFWGEAEQKRVSWSSSSDSDSGPSLPRFFIRTKDGNEPSCDNLQYSYSYICHKLEHLRTKEGQPQGNDGKVKRENQPSGLGIVKDKDIRRTPSFVPHGLFLSQRRHGWSLMLRIPEKKNRMSSRQWGPIYLQLLPGALLQLFYEKGLEKPFKEFQLHANCCLSGPKLESYGEPRKIATLKVEHVSYVERKRYHPKPEVIHEPEVEQLLKFGTTEYGDMEDLLVSIQEELMQIPVLRQQHKHYEEQELTLQISDHIWMQQDKGGAVLQSVAITQIHCLAFLNGAMECFLALNDLGLLRQAPGYGSEEDDEIWMEITEHHFHRCVRESEFLDKRLIKFCPPDACRVELMRYSTASLHCRESPLSIKAMVTVQGACVELQVFLNLMLNFPSPGGTSEMFCENIVLRVPFPGDWVKVPTSTSLLRQKSLKARMNRNACLGSALMSESHSVMQVSVGTVKYENVYRAIVWRIDRLPPKNVAVEQPQSFACKLELASDQEIPADWFPFVTVECEVADVVASHTRVKSLGTECDIQPQKHMSSRAYYHCQPKLYLSIIDDVIESIRELFYDEGVDERVLDHLKQLWESKVIESKAVEGFIKDRNPSNFVLQLPTNFSQTLHKPTVVIPAAHNITSKTNNCGSVATFSLPPGITYPVQIPAGVTLQTASGHFYKVNVPVMVTRGAQPILTRPEQNSNPPPHPTTVTHGLLGRLSDTCRPQPSVCPVPENLKPPPHMLGGLFHQPDKHTSHPNADGPPPSPADSQSEFTLDGIEFSPQLDTVSPVTPHAQGPRSELAASCAPDMLETPLNEQERAAASGVDEWTPLSHLHTKTKSDIKNDLNFSELVELSQLDGIADSSSDTEDDDEDEDEDLGLVGENEFLGMISANEEEEEEDPLNSGDDVSDQDIPEIFDTENVIVCQYDKIHRSKNRWKFYLKDGVMCYGGKDYVFSKAVGEAEW